jgi:hypothetical protein
MTLEPWSVETRLDTPAGKVLQQLAAALPKGRAFQITLFGSAPLQIGIEPSLLSGDVDLFSDAEDLEQFVKAAGSGDEQKRPYRFAAA